MAISQAVFLLFFTVSLELISCSIAQGPVMPPTGSMSMPPMTAGGDSPVTPPPSMPMTPPPMVMPMTPSPMLMGPPMTPTSPSPSPSGGGASPPSPPRMKLAPSPGPAVISPDMSSPDSGAFGAQSDVVLLSTLAGVVAHFLIV